MSYSLPIKRSLNLSLKVSLAGSVLMTTACGVGGYGVGRNPLGNNARLLNYPSSQRYCRAQF